VRTNETSNHHENNSIYKAPEMDIFNGSNAFQINKPVNKESIKDSSKK
jgi:hypothetical protein